MKLKNRECFFISNKLVHSHRTTGIEYCNIYRERDREGQKELEQCVVSVVTKISTVAIFLLTCFIYLYVYNLFLYIGTDLWRCYQKVGANNRESGRIFDLWKILVLVQFFSKNYSKHNLHFVSNKAKGLIPKRVFQENKARQIFRKINILTPWYARAYQG